MFVAEIESSDFRLYLAYPWKPFETHFLSSHGTCPDIRNLLDYTMLSRALHTVKFRATAFGSPLSSSDDCPARYPCPRPRASKPLSRYSHVSPTYGWASLHLRDLWDYREILYFFVWRNVKVRYKQTVLGVAWVVLQPLAATFLFTVIFGRLAQACPPTMSLMLCLPWQDWSPGITFRAQSGVADRVWSIVQT